MISPEGCASILWHDASKNEIAAENLKMQSENLLEFGIIDDIILEPPGGAHHEPQIVYEGVKKFILKQSNLLKKSSKETLLENRYQKFRKIGAFTVDQNAK